MQMIDRRKFLIGSTAAAIIAPSLAIAAPAETIPQSVTINWAHMLAAVLKSKHGVTILPPKYDQPMALGSVPGTVFRQLCVDVFDARDGIFAFRSGQIFSLADAIASRGKMLRFAPLRIPKGDIVDAKNIASDDISMRYLNCWYAEYGCIARLDVLFEVV